MKEVTILTANIFDNDWLERPKIQACLSTWDRMEKAISDAGCKPQLLILQHDSEIVHSFYEEIKELKITKKNLLTDVFKCWYLKNNKNTIWLDSDFYISENVKFYDKTLIFTKFGTIYNGEETEFFENAFKYYFGNTRNIVDWQVIHSIKSKTDNQTLFYKNDYWPNTFHTGLIDFAVSTNSRLIINKDGEYELRNPYTLFRKFQPDDKYLEFLFCNNFLEKPKSR